MSETYFVFITTIIATLLGFIGVIFIFWYQTRQEPPYGTVYRTTEVTQIFRNFKILVLYGFLLIVLYGIFFISYSSYKDTDNEFWIIIFISILTLIWILFCAWGFFWKVISDLNNRIADRNRKDNKFLMRLCS